MTNGVIKYYVGIGASAGGVRALEEFFATVRPPCQMAFFVVTHISAGGISLLPQILGRHTALKFVIVDAPQPLHADAVYVPPPGSTLEIRGGQVFPKVLTSDEGKPIDTLFASLAGAFKERAVGIVLSGSGADGSLGALDIKREGGVLLAQEESTATYPQMPTALMAATQVDYMVAAGAMPDVLASLLQGRPPQFPATTELRPEALQQVFELLRRFTNHDFSRYKANTISRRIERRMKAQGCDTLRDYIRLLQSVPNEIDQLFRELLINVTSFFRDPEAFDLIRHSVLPQVLSSGQQDQTIRCWVAGCSTGEEAYSLGILLRECLDAAQSSRPIQIFATDLDKDAIEVARAGFYSKAIAVDVAPERLQRFFVENEDGYRVCNDIRSMVVFAQQNVIADPPFTNLDFLTCRNLLIYLEADVQERIIPLFHYSLRPGGVLFLGSSESLGPTGSAFETIDKKWKMFRRSGSSLASTATKSVLFEPPAARSAFATSRPGVKPDLTQIADRTLAQHLLPPCVLMHERGDIVHIHGRTGLFLEPAQGSQRINNIYTMVRDGLGLELALAVRQLMADQSEEVVRQGVRVTGQGQTTGFNLRVKRLEAPFAMRGLFLVSFEGARSLTLVDGPPTPDGVIKDQADASVSTKHLQLELQHVRELQLGTHAELETAVEELKSSNEELQSANEELQSANEELETSKEEMLSLNEELNAVNHELHSKVEELSRLNDDMKNLLNSTEIATLFLDGELRIKRFTEPTRKVIRIIASDVDRPIADLVSSLNYVDLVKDATQVLATLAIHEREVQSTEGRWYLTRILPYRTSDNMIAGVVITFVDITAARKVREQSLHMLTALTRCDTVLFGCDSQYRYEWASNAVFGKVSEELIGRTDVELWGDNKDALRLRHLKEDVIHSGRPVRKMIDGAIGKGFGKFQVHLEPMRDASGVVGVVGVLIPTESGG